MELKACPRPSDPHSTCDISGIHSMELKDTLAHLAGRNEYDVLNPFNGIERAKPSSRPQSAGGQLKNPFNGIERRMMGVPLEIVGRFLGIHSMELKALKASGTSSPGRTPSTNPFNGIERLSTSTRAYHLLFESIQWNWKLVTLRLLGAVHTRYLRNPFNGIERERDRRKDAELEHAGWIHSMELKEEERASTIRYATRQESIQWNWKLPKRAWSTCRDFELRIHSMELKGAPWEPGIPGPGRMNPFNGIERSNHWMGSLSSKPALNPFNGIESRYYNFLSPVQEPWYQESIQWNWKLFSEAYAYWFYVAVNPFNGIERRDILVKILEKLDTGIHSMELKVYIDLISLSGHLRESIQWNWKFDVRWARVWQ